MAGVVKTGGQLFLVSAMLYGAIWVIDRALGKEGQEEEEKKTREPGYESLFMDELEAMGAVSPSSCQEPTVKVHQKTPRGDVIMYYDDDLSSFVYYCDDKSIPYNFLETVARRYVIDNRCPQKYVARKMPSGPKPEPRVVPGDTIFATLKRYNNRCNAVTERTNRFSWRGNLAAGKALFVNTAASPDSAAASPPKAPRQKYKMTFQDFKREQEELHTSQIGGSATPHASESESDDSEGGPTFVRRDQPPPASSSEIVATESELREVFD